MTQVQTSKEIATLLCGNLGFDPEGLVELDAGNIILRADWPDITRMKLRHGMLSPHPVLQVLFGAVLIIPALLGILHFVDGIVRGGKLRESVALLAPLGIFGIAMIWSALRKGTYLLVETKSGKRRFIFGRKVQPDSIESFVKAIESIRGASIPRETLRSNLE